MCSPALSLCSRASTATSPPPPLENSFIVCFAIASPHCAIGNPGAQAAAYQSLSRYCLCGSTTCRNFFSCVSGCRTLFDFLSLFARPCTFSSLRIFFLHRRFARLLAFVAFLLFDPSLSTAYRPIRGISISQAERPSVKGETGPMTLGFHNNLTNSGFAVCSCLFRIRPRVRTQCTSVQRIS